MGYDFLSGKTDEYVKDRKNLEQEYELFSDVKEKFDEAKAVASKLDDDIQAAFHGVQSEFVSKQEILHKQQDDLALRKSELSDYIGKELDNLKQAQGKLDALSGKKYTGGVGKAAEKCKDYITQLEGMLAQLDERASGRDYGGRVGACEANAADTGLSSRRDTDNAPTIMSRYAPIVGYHSIASDLAAINPNYSQNDPDSPWNNNCQRCVSAYEARRRGYDVQARPTPAGYDPLPFMLHPQGWPSVYKGGQLIDCSANSGTAAAMNVEEYMKNWGDNCRAIVRVRWKPEVGGGGHVFIAERVNGVTRFIDPQNGIADAGSYFDFAKGSDLYCMRIDNLDFTDRIHQCCQ